MKIALGAARGLEQLHLKVNPPIIHRDFKSANILLDKDFQPKVSDFGIAKIAPTGDELIATTAGLKGTPGYIAPEYSLCASLSIRSDIYSFGVVLLEIITGRKALDWTRPDAEQNLAYWVCFLFPEIWLALVFSPSSFFLLYISYNMLTFPPYDIEEQVLE